ncbi:uncharacterized protein LOC134834510 isoform X2 [Culicoides brevitarsis]|uniref:uncharacterized protein LOC134834510 isoform X2 n=1 Tax=Culicoides brevitarsis TaxID=469753 RepID=UPI00307B91B8
MTTDIQQQANNRSLFSKMNTDFWQQARGPPLMPHSLNLLNTAQQASSTSPNTPTPTNLSGPLGTTPSTTGSASSPGNPAGGGSLLSPTNLHHHLALMQQQQQQQQNAGGIPTSQQNANSIQNALMNLATGNLTGAGIPNVNNNNGGLPGNAGNNPGGLTGGGSGLDQKFDHLSNVAAVSQNLQMALAAQQQQQQNTQNNAQNAPQTQQLANNTNNNLNNQQSSVNNNNNPPQPPQSATPGGSSTPDIKMSAEKLVNEFQQLTRSNNASSINERTLEECWSTLQRIFMHKSAMQMQHARDLQRGGVGLGGAMGAEVKPHQCNQCLKSFSSNHQLVQHIRVHTGEKPYKCSYCDRRFKQLSHVQQHTRLHTGERPYKCHLQDCGRAFIQLSNLQQHLRNHDAQIERAKNRPFHCNICGKGFATESSLRTHTSKCNSQSGELQLHLGVLQQHAALIGGPNATSCPICHKLFLGGEALMEHMKHTHKDPNASGVATKRRSANHPCPVCGKHYVNEGSLRKHLACHPETQQLASSLRMWPCSVCQAVFTHETGLLTHMEHMRMDPKHQFAAQYVLSRAAAERRDRGGQNSMCASPSAQSDTSSNNERLSSAGSEIGGGNGGLLNNNNNNNCNNKLSVNDVLRATSNNGHLHNQYGVDEMHANRMAVMAAAANIVNQSQAAANSNAVNGQPNLNSPTPDSSAAAVQAAVVNLAAAMRMNQVANQNLNNGGNQGGNNGPSSTTPPSNNDATNAAAQAMLRVSMADTMMSMNHQPHHHQHQQNTPEAAIRMQQQAEAILRTQAEALRLVSQAAAVAASSNNGNNGVNAHHNGNNYQPNPSNNQQQVHPQNQSHPNNQQQSQPTQNQLNSQVSPELSEALRLHEQRLEQALRLQGSDPRALGFSLAGQTAQHNP